ncbi:MAG TPA: hypothetical protein VFQ71_01735 [Gaiellales bacterium]|jgi:hypothetical protein|nr:hypothetical protein [Gaiellales bacterium]
MEHPHSKLPSRDRDPQGEGHRTALYVVLVVAGVLALLGVGIARDHGHINLASSLLLYAVVLAVIVVVSRPGAE